MRFEDQVGFEDGDGLHGGYTGEDGEDLGVSRGGDLAVEEEFVHFLGGGEGLGSDEGEWGKVEWSGRESF